MGAIPPTCDVVIIGGGPAGSTAGSYLARRGYSVVLFEKQKHPRLTVGESLIPLFWRYTDEIGVSQKIEQEGFVRKMGGTVNWHGELRTHTFKEFGYDRPAYHVERERFDQILLDHARSLGVQVFEEAAVSGAVFESDEQVQITCRPAGNAASERIACRYVVDASGQSAVIGRQLGLRQMDPAFKFMSVWGYYTGSKYIAYGGQVHPETNKFNVLPTTFVSSLDQVGDWGWLWHIIMRESTSVGLVLPQDRMKAMKTPDETWEAFLTRILETTPVVNHLLAEAQLIPGSVRVIRDYSYASTSYSGPGYYLIGDAAGFVDPIFSVGVVLAMYGGCLAGWALDESLRKPDQKVRFQRLFEQQLRARLEVARSLALPRYQIDSEETSALAKIGVNFETTAGKELMYAVSSLTTRTANVRALLDDAGLQQSAAFKVKNIAQIDF